MALPHTPHCPYPFGIMRAVSHAANQGSELGIIHLDALRFQLLPHILDTNVAVGVKNRVTPKWVALVSGHMDQNLRSPGDFILTHTHIAVTGC